MKNIDLYDGEYTVVMNDNGTMHSFQRYHEHWPAAQHFIYSGLVLALVQEVIALREAKEGAKDGMPLL